MYKRFGKRILDIAGALLGLIVCALPMVVIALAIRHEDHGPVFFTQTRYGLRKKPFTIYKFRTMSSSAPHDVPSGQLPRPDEHILRFGRRLRMSSLDELPQLFNILRGDMSLVGPRPVILKQADLIAERDRFGANELLPGLTGWAQINGRDELSMEQIAAYDGEYVQKQSFWFDLRCLWKTVGKVLRREGVREGAADSGNQTL